MSYWPDQRDQTVYRADSPRGRPGDGMASEGMASERSARLTITCLAAGFTVLVVGLVVFLTVRTLRQDDAATTPVEAGPAATTPEDAARVVGGIGPPAGADVVSYVNTRKAALATATGDRLAVVSLTKYLSESKARAAAGSAEVVALLAAAPGGQPATVVGGIAAWVSSQTTETRLERDEIQKLIPTVDDPSFKSFYRSEVDRLNKVLANLSPTGDLVFGIVVKAPAPVLQQLATSADVRLVDVGETADPGPKPAYRGLRPEETSKANDPNTRPA